MSVRKLGRYQLMHEVGHGGMAVVYAAWQEGLDRWVAVKELRLGPSPDPTLAQRFLREARTAGNLNSPNVVTVHEHFVAEGTPYIAMELLERGSLRPYVGRTDLPQFVGVMQGVLTGLGHAAGAGVVHRDLKPENLLVTHDGAIKIADFGIARARNLTNEVFATQTGITSGTPQYMAPEQVLAKDIGPYTDLYSLGVIAYEMLVGRTPFRDTQAPMAVAHRHLEEPIPLVHTMRPEVDPELSAWVDRLLIKDWRERPHDPAEVWQDLEEIAIEQLGTFWHRGARLPELEGLQGRERLTPPSVVVPVDSTASAPTPVAPERVAPDLGAPSVTPQRAEPPVPPPPLRAETGFATFAPRRARAAQAAGAEAPEAAESTPEEATPEESTPGGAAAPEAAEAMKQAGEASPDRGAAEAREAAEAWDEPREHADPETAGAGGEPTAAERDESQHWRTAIAALPRRGRRAQAEPAPEPEELAEAEGQATEAAPVVEPGAEPAHDEGDATVPPRRIVPAPATATATEHDDHARAIRRRRRVAGGTAVAALAALTGGYALGHGGPDSDPNAARLPARAQTADGLTIRTPAAWRPAAPATAATIGGARVDATLAAGPGGDATSGATVAALVGPVTPGLLPDGLDDDDAGTPVRLSGGLQALRHEDADLGALGRGRTFAVATGDGAVLVVCAAPVVDRACDAMATTLAISGRTPQGLAPDAAFAADMERTLGALADGAAGPRAQLRDATTRAGQRRAALRAAVPYDRAATALGRLRAPTRAGAPTDALTAATAGVATQLGRLAAAAGDGDRARYDAARKAVGTQEAAMADAAEQLRTLGYAVRSAR